MSKSDFWLAIAMKDFKLQLVLDDVEIERLKRTILKTASRESMNTDFKVDRAYCSSVV